MMNKKDIVDEWDDMEVESEEEEEEEEEVGEEESEAEEEKPSEVVVAEEEIQGKLSSPPLTQGSEKRQLKQPFPGRI